MSALCIHVPKCVWTDALFDSSVKVEGFDVVFEAAQFDPRGSRRLRGEVEDQYAGSEQVLTDYVVRIARGTEKELAILPIFVTRGMVHRKLVMRRDRISPGELKGRSVGMGRVLGATSVYLRGLLQDLYDLKRSEARWIAAEPLTSDGAMGGEWRYLHARGGFKASELIQRLNSGEIDAVIYPGGAGGHWFNWLAQGNASRTPDPYGDLEDMVAANPQLCFPMGDVASHVDWFKEARVYPTYHCLGIRRGVAESRPGLADALVDAFDRAAEKAPEYMSAAERELYDREKEILGIDPNCCGLTKVHQRTLEKCIEILDADGLLPHRPTMREIFPLSTGKSEEGV